ncbi:hypothetical protein MYXA107069_35115 [Myxococcus xanthus]|nr:hypothetical protein MyxoNM_09585 [Myxococcus xanthus]SDY26168.1 hypothetical protein SAMN05444383_12838 [Myxococcus xanthus]
MISEERHSPGLPTFPQRHLIEVETVLASPPATRGSAL